ncbi:MAG: MBL fold metallo-hydrolase [Xanthomonadales bacterium]|nr:MBL fold metallo-hydrolase [Xanthomonadales bacterium]
MPMPSAHLAGALSYPFDEVPETGQAVDIVPGVMWLRLPLPFLLNHINVWLLRDGPGWALVDTGLFTETTREVWKNALERYLEALPLTRILVTHLHPDHVGCAGWLARKFAVELWMPRDEYLLCRVLVADTGKPAPPEGLRFYQAAGFDGNAIERYAEHFGAFAPLGSHHRPRALAGARVPAVPRTWAADRGRPIIADDLAQRQRLPDRAGRQSARPLVRVPAETGDRPATGRAGAAGARQTVPRRPGAPAAVGR